MSKKVKSIPVNYFGDEFNSGISLERISFKDLPDLSEWSGAERHDRHSFFLLEKGMVTMEIDFQKYKIIAPSIIYMHPSQVHRILSFKNVTVNAIGINDENLNSDYLKLLENISPAKPLILEKDSFSLLLEAVKLCLKFSTAKEHTLRLAFLKDSVNAVIAFIISYYLRQKKSRDKLSRFEMVSKSFRELLESNFVLLKNPAAYAKKLNISTSYLNECVKNVSGYPVSHHIQQRVILEAKRLLYHSDKSVKEISADLGYEDYPYFSRLFTKVTGISALVFRARSLKQNSN